MVDMHSQLQICGVQNTDKQQKQTWKFRSHTRADNGLLQNERGEFKPKSHIGEVLFGRNASGQTAVVASL